VRTNLGKGGGEILMNSGTKGINGKVLMVSLSDMDPTLSIEAQNS